MGQIIKIAARHLAHIAYVISGPINTFMAACIKRINATVHFATFVGKSHRSEVRAMCVEERNTVRGVR